MHHPVVPEKWGRTTEPRLGMMSLDLLEEPPKIASITHTHIYNVGKTMSETIPQSSPFPQVVCLTFPGKWVLKMVLFYPHSQSIVWETWKTSSTQVIWAPAGAALFSDLMRTWMCIRLQVVVNRNITQFFTCLCVYMIKPYQ